MRARSLFLLAPASVLALVAACAGSDTDPASPPADPDASATLPSTEGEDPGDDPVDAGVDAPVCTDGETYCASATARRVCSGGQWVDEPCAAGSGCYAGACAASKCSDECTIGEEQGGKTCAPFDIAAGKPATLDPDTKLHDRAREYFSWLDRSGMAAGAVGSAHYSDAPTYATIDAMHGIGDSAIWTGTLLAAEALRLRSTGSPEARERVRSLVKTMHLFMNVSGEPGVLVRFAKESSTTYSFAMPDMDCDDARVHCNIPYDGKTYDFAGHVSRDQYQGVMLGLSLAYEALTSADEDVRELIRHDVVTLVWELMKERSVPITIKVNDFPPVDTTIPMRFIVLSPREMVDGKVHITLSSTGGDDDGEMVGLQEFTPNLRDIVKHVPGIGGILGGIDIPRSSSAIMLASFFQVALHVTDGVPSYQKARDAIRAYYLGHSGEGGNVYNWLSIAKQWSPGTKCGDKYYGNNITMMPLYNLARLEDDPGRSQTVIDDVLAKGWPAFANTKNTFFSFIYAAVTPGADPSVATSAAAQLAGFPAAPRVRHPVDLRNSPKYPNHDAECTDQVDHGGAVDVADRVVGDFIWQRHPWGLYDPGDVGQTEPGIDYLVAYYLGYRHGFISDDTPGVCLTWQ